MNQPFGKLSIGRKSVKTDVVGVDVGATTTRVVRLKRTGDTIALVAADLLPHQILPSRQGTELRPLPLILPKHLRAPYAAVAVSSPQGCIRLLSTPSGVDRMDQLNLKEMLGLAEGQEYRIGYEVLPSEGRAEQLVLAVGIPEAQARWASALFPVGLPAPCSLQVGGAAMLNVCGRERTAHQGDTCPLFIQVGCELSDVAVFHKGRLALYRQCTIGSQSVVASVRAKFDLAEDLVPGILEDDLIDATQTINEAIEPFLRQLVLAREFVERKRSCRVERILICGTVLGAKHWVAQIEKAIGIKPELWNPLASFAVAPDALTERVLGMESRFAGAVGAALAVLEGA